MRKMKNKRKIDEECTDNGAFDEKDTNADKYGN